MCDKYPTTSMVYANIAFIKYRGGHTFLDNFYNSKQGIKIKETKKRTIVAVSEFPTLLSFKILCRVRVNNVY
jgi:hypothetical protein